MRTGGWFLRMLMLTIAVLLALPATALGAIRITKIAFDPPGSDSGTNRHLNKEWIEIKNTGNASKNLDRWKVLDRGPDHRYRFSGISLPGGDLLRLHTGSGSHRVTSGCGGSCSIHHYYWGLDNYVWNNDGDRATVKKPSQVVDRCHYGPAASSPKRC